MGGPQVVNSTIIELKLIVVQGGANLKSCEKCIEFARGYIAMKSD